MNYAALILVTVLLGFFTLVQSMYHPQTAVSQHALEKQNQRQACQVLFVYDGDTFLCDLDGDGKKSQETEKIRLLGINAPEMHYSPKRQKAHLDDEPFATEANAQLKSWVDGKTVYLEFDRDLTDRYGRTLAFVFTAPQEGTSLNEALVQAGLAKTMFIGANQRYRNRFERLEAQARYEKRGLWQTKAQ